MRPAEETTGVLLDRLLQQPIQRAEFLVRNDRRFQTPELVELLLAEHRAAVFGNPKMGQHFARLALVAAEQLDGETYGQRILDRCRICALAYLGHAHCAAGEAGEALRQLQRAQELSDRSDTLSGRAILLSFLGALYIEERRGRQAEVAIAEALEIARRVDDDGEAARCLCRLGLLRLEAGRVGEALAPLKEAMALLDPEEDPSGSYAVRVNLIVCHARSGGVAAARRLLDRSAWLFAHHRARLPWPSWLQGLVAAGEGHFERAETHFQTAWRGLLDQSLHHDWGAALLGLDIMALYARRGRRPQLQGFAREMAPIVFWPGLHREAAAALGKLLQAIDAEPVCCERIEAVCRFVQCSRHDPGARLGPG